MIKKYGKLYLVATPIGNLADLSFRAVATLKAVNLIAAEDTRHVKLLLQHYSISNKVLSFHQHNEEKVSGNLIEKLLGGLDIALVSDAGTPLISDPGLPLVKKAQEAGIVVTAIPGACALVAALSVAGVPVIPFVFEGFLPRTSGARKAFLAERINYPSTWVFYESSHRILATLQDMAAILPPEREIVIARELTKLHETVVRCSLADALAIVTNDENMRKGEFVVIVTGADVKDANDEVAPEHIKLLTVLMRQCPLKTAVEMAVEITGTRKKLLYQAALMLENKTIP